MSTAATTHHRISDPFATAAAVAVIIAGATVLGVAAFQGEDTTPTAPPAPVHGKTTVDHPARVGLGDFTQTQQGGGGHQAPLHGGHTTLGLP